MLSFDSSPILYWLPVYGLCWAVLWMTVRVGVSRRVFLLTTLTLLFLLRLPSVVFNYEINPDESQMITQAMTLRQDPVYFRSVDGTTGGPLDSYLLILPNLLGLPFDYITAHLMAFGLLAGCLVLLFHPARLWFGEPAVRLALLALVFALGLTQSGDFLHYSSELLPLVLLSGSYYLYATLLADGPKTRPTVEIGRLFLTGLLLGMVPFGKLQAVPLMAVVGLFTGIAILTRQNLTVGQKTTRLVSLGLGGLLFPAFFVGLMALNGVFSDFVTFYLIGNVRYASNSDQWQNVLRLPDFFARSGSFVWFIILALGGALLGGILTFLPTTRPNRRAFERIGFVVVLFVSTIFAITRTGSEYVHYLFLLTGPLLFGLAYGWQQLHRQTAVVFPVSVGLTGLFLALFGIQTGYDYASGMAINRYSSEHQAGLAIQQSPVSKVIAQYARPGEKLVVWGWRCDYYVQTQMPQGVAENHTIRSAYRHPLQKVYQQRYFRNFVRSFPPVFVDAVGNQNLWLTNRQTQGHEIIRPLAQFVAAHYQYVGLVNDTRIYVRQDRLNGYAGKKPVLTQSLAQPKIPIAPVAPSNRF